jgi:hypothetical protein
MAKIALAAGAGIAGGVGGFLLGGPLGAVQGAVSGVSLGLAVGNMLFGKHPPGQAPLQDLNVSSSADGTPIPFGYGTHRFAGQVIWSPGITYRKLDIGKGGPRASTFAYSASFAAAFGEGPSSIGRIWGDSKLIYKGGQPFGQVTVWTPTGIYHLDDLVSYRWNPGAGYLTAIFQCLLTSQNIVPPGNSLYWSSSGYAFYDDATQYYPGNEVVYPGDASSNPRNGAVYAASLPTKGCNPLDCTDAWHPLSSYYAVPTLYPGDETQDPDPLIQGIQGADRTPAFRGVAYGVWEDFPLDNFGSRIPNLRAEVTFA